MTKSRTAYPFNAQTYPKGPSFLLEIESAIATWKQRRQGIGQLATALQMIPPANLRPLRENDLPLVATARNELKFLRSFLSHYRTLGVSRFIFIDDGSDDGTVEFLLSQPDVDLWSSTLRYGEAGLGRMWREFIFKHYGFNRWYINIDVDEYLIYDHYLARPLPELISRLENEGISRLPAPMIDMYPNGRLGDFVFDGSDDAMPWVSSTHLDGDDYNFQWTKKSPSVKGGPRARIFGSWGQLMKFPLIYWDEKCSLGQSIHYPLPFTKNLTDISGVLLHFKFFADLGEKVSAAITDNQHYDGAREYRAIAQQAETMQDLNFMYSKSVAYENAEQLTALGFMKKLWR